MNQAERPNKDGLTDDNVLVTGELGDGRMDAEMEKTYKVAQMTIDDIEPANDMRLQSWLDTYVNEELGVTRQWVESRNQTRVTDASRKDRRERFEQYMANHTMNAWVARDQNIGATTPYVDSRGVQHVGSLYVDAKWHGKGVASDLMRNVIGWFDSQKPIVLGVVAYNRRALAFYEKWGFEIEPGSETFFEDKMPEIKMVRKGGCDEV